MSEEIEQGTAPENAEVLAETGIDPAKSGAPAASEQVEETDEQKNARVQADQEKESKKRANGFQKRIDELTADKHAARQMAADLAEQNKRILALLEGNKASVAAKSDGEPTRDKFDNYEDYLEARADWRAERKALELLDSRQKANEEARTKVGREQEAQGRQRDYQKRMAETAKTVPDYHEVMGESDVSLPQGVLDTIMVMPDGPLIAYHIAKQPALADQFNETQDPRMHAVYLGQLSATLKAPSKASNAPAPGKTTKAATVSGGDSENPPKDPKAYMAWAAKHMR